MKRVFVTGALGFIGRALVGRLRTDGVEVRGVDIRAQPDLDVVAGDVSAPGHWQRHARGADVVIHTAALVSLRSGLEEFHRVNVLGTRYTLDAALTAGAERFVQISSVTVFGNDFPDGVTEEHPVRLLGVPYVDTKIAGEQIVLQSHAAEQLGVTVVRPGDVYGPASNAWILTPLRELQRRRLVLPGRGRGIHSPIFLDDLIDGIVAAAGSPAARGQVLTLSGGEGVTTSDYFGRVAAMSGHSVPSAPTGVLLALTAAVAAANRVRRVQSEINPNSVRYLTRHGTYSIAKARRLIEFAPRVGLDEGMRRSEAWLRAEGILGPPDVASSQ